MVLGALGFGVFGLGGLRVLAFWGFGVLRFCGFWGFGALGGFCFFFLFWVLGFGGGFGGPSSISKFETLSLKPETL